MFLAEPQRTPYDLHFDLFGFPIRVTPFFWLVAVILGYNIAVSLDRSLPGSPGLGALLLMWVAAVFLSILIHELGHAFVMRRYGMNPYIVLYHFGGVAVSDAMSSVFRSSRSGRGSNQIAISIAGPGAQLLLATVIVLGIRLLGYESLFPVFPIDMVFPVPEGRPLPSVALDVMLFFLVMPSIFWALLNLLPIFPLDGGHISREIFIMFMGSNGFRNSLVLSIGVAALGAIYFLGTGNHLNAIFFISLAMSNFQLLQTLRFGGGPW